MTARARKSQRLNSADIEALACFFAFFWAVVVLNPREQQSIRAIMRRLGLVRPKGKLALTSRGKRAAVVWKAARK
jgi:hypothetical protein